MELRESDWSGRYTSSVANGALYLRESRLVAELLLHNVTAAEWKDAIYQENILQIKSPQFARKVGNLCRARLKLVSSELKQLVKDGSKEVATHACLAASIKHSFLLGDFLDLQLRELYCTGERELKNSTWEKYLDACYSRDPKMPSWGNSTLRALKSSVFKLLAQAGYVESTTDFTLNSVFISKEVLRQLEADDESYVFRCITVGER